jgi:hypothetical protein
MVDEVWCFSVNMFDFVPVVMSFEQWVSMGRGRFVEASGGSGGGGFLVDLGVLNCGFSLRFWRNVKL